jgi:cell division protein FtsB
VRPLLVAALLVTGAALWAWLDAEDGVETWRRLRREVVDAEARVGRAAERNAGLGSEIEALRADPFEQERAVREELRWSRPGEIVVRAPRPAAPAASRSGREALP